MRNLRRLQQHLQRVGERLRADESRRLMSPEALNDAVVRYKQTGVLPEHPAQRQAVMELTGIVQAMQDSVPNDDGMACPPGGKPARKEIGQPRACHAIVGQIAREHGSSY